MRTLTEAQVALIKQFQNVDYDFNNTKYPIGVCGNCRLLLGKKAAGKECKLPKMLNYQDIILPKSTRSTDSNIACNCNICLTARHHAKDKRITSEEIDNSTGLVASSNISQLPNKEPPKKKKTSLSICAECKQEIGRGISHVCSIAESSAHIVDHVNTLPGTQQEQVITSLLKEKAKEADSSFDPITNKSLSLSTKGSKLRVTLNPKATRTVNFSSESLDQLQNTLNNISNRHMKTIANYLRVRAGRTAVEPGFANHLTKKGQKLSDLYKLSWHQFEAGDDQQVNLPVVWANAEDLLSTVSEAREYLGSPFVKIMADGGQNFLKICATILPENYHPDLDRAQTESDDEEDIEHEVKKRSTYKEGGSIGKYKLTSVKKVIMVAIVPECKETYHNMKILFELTRLNDIKFLFVADFKLLLLCLGCQSASATYPCPYYLVNLREISQVGDHAEDLQEPRTFGLLERSHDKFVTSHGSKKKEARYCNSTVGHPLFSEDSEVLVVDKCPPEELHCLQGFVNHTFNEGYAKEIGREKALKFPKLINVVASDYHNKIFEGNACREMLKKASLMDDRRILGDDISPLKVSKYIRAFKAMNKIVETCFGTKVIGENSNVVKMLDELVSSYMDLDISVTLKLHVIFFHLLPALQNPVLKGRGLGIVSGQAGESIHAEFKIFWEKYKIKSLDNPNYAENFKRAVVEFSSKHI